VRPWGPFGQIKNLMGAGGRFSCGFFQHCNGCYSSFSICMKENTDFVFPEKMDVIEKNEQIISDHFTEKEQNVNLKRCKRLNFYGKKI
jgi:hypothetical protein